MSKHFIATIALSNIFFWIFISFGINFWLENRAVKYQADQQYSAMLAVVQDCQAAISIEEPSCIEMKKFRLELDRLVQSSAHYSSLTRLFISFALFLPLLTWASFYLTRAIFR